MSRRGFNYDHAVEVIKRFPENEKMYELYRQDWDEIMNGTKPAPEIRISGKGWPGNPTESRGMRLASIAKLKHLEAATLAVANTIKDYTGHPDKRSDEINRAMLRIIDLCYWKHTHTITGAAMEVHYSEQHARRLRARFVMHVLDYLGW